MNKQNLYTVRQLAKACSISRATVLRLEKDGLLTPTLREGSAEYRYYDCAAIMRVLQILSLQKLGFTREEIREYYRLPGDFRHCLSVLEERLDEMERFVERMRQRADLSNHMKIERIHIPDTVCYVKSIRIHNDYRTINHLAQDAFKEAVDHGLKVDGTRDFFSLVDAYELLDGKEPDGIYEYSSCIPLSCPPGTPHTVTIPGCEALAVTWHRKTPTDTRKEAYIQLGKALREQGLMPAGRMRIFGIVHQYMGQEIPRDRNVVRITQPIQT